MLFWNLINALRLNPIEDEIDRVIEPQRIDWIRDEVSRLKRRTDAFIAIIDRRIAMSTFQVGDVVRLKSGGPAMTVVWADDQSLLVEWYEDGRVRSSAVSTIAVDPVLPVGDDTLKTAKAYLEKEPATFDPEKDKRAWEDGYSGAVKVDSVEYLKQGEAEAAGRKLAHEMLDEAILVDAAEGRVLGAKHADAVEGDGECDKISEAFFGQPGLISSRALQIARIVDRAIRPRAVAMGWLHGISLEAVSSGIAVDSWLKSPKTG